LLDIMGYFVSLDEDVGRLILCWMLRAASFCWTEMLDVWCFLLDL
jgi:hypothetical protein